MATYSVNFDPCVQRMEAKTFCTKCKRKLTRVVSECFYNNGFHNATEIARKNWILVKKEVARQEKHGVVCQTCEDIQNNTPVLKKIDNDTYEAFDRATKKKLGVIHRYVYGGWPKWITYKPKKDWHHNLKYAAESLKANSPVKPKR